MAAIQLLNITKAYPNGPLAARDVTLDIADGELLVLVGPSGCGKSTLLRLIAGLESPSSGSIFVGGRDVTGLPPQKRDLAMVFQSYALYPHLSVGDNLAFGLRMRGAPRDVVQRRVSEAARTLGIEPLLDRRPAALSGGQRQRVALGRAIVREPAAFLFDEPLSNLDPALRAETRAELSLLHRRLRATMVYVTHDQEEAMTLGNRIAVMRDGAIEQVAGPLEVFERPANPFVAQFIGAPAMNLFEGQVAMENGTARVRCGPLTVNVPGVAVAPGTPVIAGVRPHDFEIVGGNQGTARAANLTGRVEVVEPLGSSTLLRVRSDVAPDTTSPRTSRADTLVRVVVSPEVRPAIDEPVALRVKPGCVHLFDRRSGRRLAALRRH